MPNHNRKNVFSFNPNNEILVIQASIIMQLKSLFNNILPSFSVLHLFFKQSSMPPLTSGVKLSFSVTTASKRSPLRLSELKQSVMSMLKGLMYSWHSKPRPLTKLITSVEVYVFTRPLAQSSSLYVVQRVSTPLSPGQISFLNRGVVSCCAFCVTGTS